MLVFCSILSFFLSFLLSFKNFVEAERQLESSQEAGEEVPLGVYMNLMWEHLKRGNIEECMQYKEQ